MHQLLLQGAASYQSGQTAQARDVCLQALRLAQRPVDARRSIPLAKFAALSAAHAQFDSLQKGAPAASQLCALQEAGWDGPQIIDHTAALHDFDDTGSGCVAR